MMVAAVGLFAVLGLSGLCALAGYGAGIRKGFKQGYHRGVEEMATQQMRARVARLQNRSTQ